MSVIAAASSRMFFSRARNDPAARRVKIQLFGDSVLRGYLTGAGGVRAAAYPELLMRNFFERVYGSGEVRVETRAVDGTYTKHLLDGTDGLNLPWPQSVNADLVIINHGVNDASYIAANSWTQAQYSSTLQSLIATCPVPVVLLTPTPVSNANPNLAPAMRTVATNTGTQLIDVRAYIDTVPNWVATYSPDGIHLNNAGYQLIYANSILPALAPIVASMR